jgi:phospholipase/carboxylesterase
VRAVAALLLGVLATAVACAGEEGDLTVRRRTGADQTERAGPGRLQTRLGAVPSDPGPAGPHPLGLARGRDGLVYVPPGYRPDSPAPLVLALHGAGGTARDAVELLRPFADREGLVVLAVDSREPTWDVIVGGYGPDVEFIDTALAHVSSRYAVDAERLAVAGFSDGASYALSLGLTNGDLFGSVLAFSPGFARPADRRGEPRLFVSHGIHDRVLPIDVTSRRVVPRLRALGYRVAYQEFDGGHSVPAEVAAEAISWFLDEAGSPTTASPWSG